MHHAPTTAETKLLEGATSAELLDYFLTRAMECEEVWGLSNASGWVMKEDGDMDILPVWSYDVMAQESAQGEWSDYTPDATSLEHFIYGILSQLQEQEIQVEILPSPQSKGLLIEAKALFEIFERKLDTVEYFLEG
jgi:hypothetical protein